MPRKLLEHDRRQRPLPSTPKNLTKRLVSRMLLEGHRSVSLSRQSESSTTVSTVLGVTETQQRDHFWERDCVGKAHVICMMAFHFADEILATAPSCSF